MYLQDIDCYAASSNKFERQAFFNISTNCVTNIYLRLLTRYITKHVTKVIVSCHETLPTKAELSHLPEIKTLSIEQRKERWKEGTRFHQNMVENLLDTLIVHCPFNFQLWFAANRFTKKQMIAEAIHAGMLAVADEFKWETNPLHEAYKTCEKLNFENNWIVDRLKTKSSPSRKYKAAIYVEYDIDEFRTFVIIYNKQGNKLARTLLHRLDTTAPKVYLLQDAYNMTHGRTKWIGNEFLLFDKSGSEVGRMNVNEILTQKKEFLEHDKIRKKEFTANKTPANDKTGYSAPKPGVEFVVEEV